MQVTDSNPNPLVSVLMCTYNVKHYIEDAVNSILHQTYTNWELLISDDYSTDGTREWLETLQSNSKVRLIFQDKNIGYVANKNFLITQANGVYITQNDSDDLSDLSRLEKQIGVCLKHPEIKIVASGYNKIDSNGNIYQTIAMDHEFIYQNYNGEDYKFWFPPLLVHQDIYKEIGLFTNYFAGMGDDLYWTVKANEQSPIYCLPDVLYSYRDNPNSITNVLDNSRKLIVPELLRRIIQQRKEHGTDWLEEGNTVDLKNLEQQLLNDKKFMAERHRIWAAKAIDKKNWKDAKHLLIASFIRSPFQNTWFRTFLYYLRQQF